MPWVQCPTCKGAPGFVNYVPSADPRKHTAYEVCQRCKGKGTVDAKGDQ